MANRNKLWKYTRIEILTCELYQCVLTHLNNPGQTTLIFSAWSDQPLVNFYNSVELLRRTSSM
jgi:hypothetical protein